MAQDSTTTFPTKNEPSEGQLDFYDLSLSELGALLEEQFSLKAFRAKQLFQWVYQKGVTDPYQMTNIGKETRAKLAKVFFFPSFVHKTREISTDGTRKYLFEMSKKDLIESVMIKQSDRMTLCVSSQVGCALGCKFCQTGTMGLKRNLSTSEIVRQFVGVKTDAENFGDMYSNVVFMGMGEPLHNFKGVTKAIEVIGEDLGLGLSGRKVTLSSAGLVPAIEKFGKLGSEVNLAISLNATTNEVRSQIMPINERYCLEELLQVLRAYPLKKRKRMTIEYVMLAGINDTKEDLKRLPKLLHGIPSKINLIPYNDNAGLGFEEPEERWVRNWQSRLLEKGFVTTVRWSKGRDINAACGQLVTASTQKRRAA